MVSPLSITLSLMLSASLANSSGSPRRCGKGVFSPSDFCTSGGRPRIIGVMNRPGAIVITRMPKRASSRAIGSVIDTMPPFEAA